MQLNGQRRQTRGRHDGFVDAVQNKKQNFNDGRVAIATNIYIKFLQERENT
jgi:hypothetical protein